MLRADDAQAAGVVRRAAADLGCAGHIVKVQPLAAVRCRDNALGAQHRAERRVAERGQRVLQLVLRVLVRGLLAPGGEHLVRVVVVAAAAVIMVVVMVMLVIMVMVVAAAGAVRAVVVMVLIMFMVVIVMMLMVMVVMLMLMLEIGRAHV